MARTIELTAEQQNIVETRIVSLEADLAVEQGKAFLLGGEFSAAAVAFRVANRHRKSLKLTAITWLAMLAPRTLLKYYRSYRSTEIVLAPRRVKG